MSDFERLQRAIDDIRKEQNGEGGDESDTQSNFSIISSAVAFYGDSPESENLDYVVANGYLPLYAAELRREPSRTGIVYTGLTTSTTICLSERNAAKVAESGVVAALAEFTKKYEPQPMAALSLTAMTNLALHSVAHKALKQAGVLKIALGLLRFLSSDQDVEIDFGLTSASLICRLYGYEESGEGPEAIKSNGKLVEKLHWILKEVLDAGPGGTVIGYTWNPANIVYDISVLSVSDRNKPLLVSFVDLVTRALEERKTNQRLVRYAIVALSQLYFEPKCRLEFERCKPRLLTILTEVIEMTATTDNETWRSATMFKSSLVDKPKTTSASGGGGTKLRSVVGGLRAIGGKSSSNLSTSNKKHVMISYQLEAQETAKVVDARLREAGFKTWIDVNDMGDNLNDSISFAVENAQAVVVLFSRKYKETSNCRKECELSDALQKPMIYVRVEPDYKAEGWLFLIMGRSLWIEAAAPDALGQLTKQISQVTGTAASSSSTPPPALKLTASSSSSGTPPSEVKEIHTLVSALVKQFGEMQKEIKAIREEVATLKKQ